MQKQEAELRDAIIANPDIRTGNNWVAEVKEVETNRLDVKELRAMHQALLEEYTFPQKTVRVELSAITEDGEIVSARRARHNHAPLVAGAATESQQT